MAKQYRFKKTLTKGAMLFVYGGISYLLAHVTSLPPTQTVVIGTSLLKMLENYLKNKV